MEIGLFFGSFNPIHIGHLIIANTILEQKNISQVWFVVSPLNPFKSSKSLLHEFDRIDMVELAIEDNFNMRASNVEFDMPKPSYTIDTLTYLAEKYPQHHFRLIIGEDNLMNFHKWKNYKNIVELFGLEIYPRPGGSISNNSGKKKLRKSGIPSQSESSSDNSTAIEIKNHPNIRMVEAPLLDISATYIRNAIREGRSIKYLVHERVEEFIRDRKLYL